MDRFMLDDVEDEYDAVEPMRPSSFDMSFTLSTGVGAAHHQAAFDPLFDPLQAQQGGGNSNTTTTTTTNSINSYAAGNAARKGSGAVPPAAMASPGLTGAAHASELRVAGSAMHHERDADAARRTTGARGFQDGSVGTTAEEGAFAGFTAEVDDTASGTDSGNRKPGTAGGSSSGSLVDRLEEKAQETIQIASLVGRMEWKLAKRMQDVHVYRPCRVNDDEASKIIFRVSCEVKASLSTVMDYLAPCDSKNYSDIESKVFPGLLHASVIKKMDVATNTEITYPQYHAEKENNNLSPRTQYSANEDMPEYPQLQVKWHASRFAGRFVKPVDFFFVEYANVDTLPDGRKRGYGYIRSVESFKGDELASRLNSEHVSIPPSVSKCKRAVINKGMYTVTPVDAASSYEVALMMVIDFQDQFTAAVGQKIVQNFTSRLVGIRELLYKTLFQPVTLITRAEWNDDDVTRCVLCRYQFTLVKPRHHCRSCGEAVCGQCSRKWVAEPGENRTNEIRLCTSCSLRARSLQPNNDAPSSPQHLLSSSHASGLSSMRSATSTTSAKGSSSNVPKAFSATTPVKRRPPPPPPPRRTEGKVELLPMGVAPLATTTRASTSSSSHSSPSGDIMQGDVKVASVMTTEKDTDRAIRTTVASVVAQFGGYTPHFMMVSYSGEHDGNYIYSALADVLPETLFMGGTSSGGVFSEAGALDSGHVLGLWAIYDPEGSYAVLNADLASETPRDATRRCVLAGMRLLCLEPAESPDFVWMNLSEGCEEVVVRALNEVVDCSFTVAGGGSYGDSMASPTRPKTRYPATQICSEGSNVGCVTTRGLCFAICSPSVEVAHACFTCYEPREKQLTVTESIGRTIYTMNQKPAFTALNDACHGMLVEFVSQPKRFSLTNSKLPLYYPLGRKCHDSRTTKLSKYQVLQPLRAEADLALVVGGDVREGDKLRIMSVSSEDIEDRMAQGFREALRASLPVVNAVNVVGCLLTASTNYPSMLKDESQILARATARTFRRCSMLGSVSVGQQGVLLCTNEVVHTNGMVSALLITNRKKSFKLNPLRPVLLRRFSTY